MNNKQIKINYKRLKDLLSKFFYVRLDNFINTRDNNYYLNLNDNYFQTIYLFLSLMSDSYRKKLYKTFNDTLTKPHILTTQIHNKFILDIIKYLCKSHLIEVTFINPNKDGNLDPLLFKKNIKESTFLISVPYINVDTGTIININEIGLYAHQMQKPLHVDIFSFDGIYDLNVRTNFIDICTTYLGFVQSNISLLIMNKDVINGYKIYTNLLYNKFEYSITGYKEIEIANKNLAKIFTKRKQIINKLYKLKKYFIEELTKHLHYVTYNDIENTKEILSKKNEKFTNQILFDSSLGKNSLEFIVLGPNIDDKFRHIPNIITISIIKNKGTPIDNHILVKYLKKNKINANLGHDKINKYENISDKLKYLELSRKIINGLIIIKLPDYSDENYIKKITKYLISGIKKQIHDIE